MADVTTVHNTGVKNDDEIRRCLMLGLHKTAAASYSCQVGVKDADEWITRTNGISRCGYEQITMDRCSQS